MCRMPSFLREPRRQGRLGTAPGKGRRRVHNDRLQVKRFGAKGEGRADDMKAMQKAPDEAFPAGPYPNGILSRCGCHCHSTGRRKDGDNHEH